jgi:hypothetical protein
MYQIQPAPSCRPTSQTSGCNVIAPPKSPLISDEAARVIPQPGQAVPVQMAKGQNVGPSSVGETISRKSTPSTGAATISRSRQVVVIPV